MGVAQALATQAVRVLLRHRAAQTALPQIARAVHPVRAVSHLAVCQIQVHQLLAPAAHLPVPHRRAASHSPGHLHRVQTPAVPTAADPAHRLANPLLVPRHHRHQANPIASPANLPCQNHPTLKVNRSRVNLPPVDRSQAILDRIHTPKAGAHRKAASRIHNRASQDPAVTASPVVVANPTPTVHPIQKAEVFRVPRPLTHQVKDHQAAQVVNVSVPGSGPADGN